MPVSCNCCIGRARLECAVFSRVASKWHSQSRSPLRHVRLFLPKCSIPTKSLESFHSLSRPFGISVLDAAAGLLALADDDSTRPCDADAPKQIPHRRFSPAAHRNIARGEYEGRAFAHGHRTAVKLTLLRCLHALAAASCLNDCASASDTTACSSNACSLYRNSSFDIKPLRNPDGSSAPPRHLLILFPRRQRQTVYYQNTVW